MDFGWIVAAVAGVVLAGQILAARADYFLSVENPRPVGERTEIVTIKAWGLISQSRESRFIAGTADLGVADMRFFTTPAQLATSIFTLGFLRPVSITYRCHAGGQPLGEA